MSHDTIIVLCFAFGCVIGAVGVGLLAVITPYVITYVYEWTDEHRAKRLRAKAAERGPR
jgi:uncharacterized protein (DUF2062 family)